jgi:hypothetical protein
MTNMLKESINLLVVVRLLIRFIVFLFRFVTMFWFSVIRNSFGFGYGVMFLS